MNRAVPAARGERRLPLDSDLEVEDRPAPQPVHLKPRYLLLVAAGGTVGTAAREGLSITVPPLGDLPLTTLVINVVGAFLLGLLLDLLVRGGPDAGRRRTLRLLLGTGALGGFTTYSTLATDTALLLRHGAAATAVLSALGTVLLGALATWAGVTLGAAIHRARRS